MSELPPKVVSLFAMDSPLFDILWPVIFEVADRETQDCLHLCSSYFKNMWKFADVQHKSDAAKAEYKKILDIHPLPAESQLTCNSTPWYAWGAREAGFGSWKGFFNFCAIAGVDPESGHLVDPEDEYLGWVFVSSDNDLTFRTLNDPLGSRLWKGYVHEFGCTGERVKSLKLEKWWMDTGDAGELFRGTRYVNPISNETF